MSWRAHRFGNRTVLAATLFLAGASFAAAQQPTTAQRDALRANCRSDFQSNCAGVQPGGRDALMCLKNNVAKLSPGCQGAVNAIFGAPAQSAPPPPPAAAAPPIPPAVSAPASSAAPAVKEPTATKKAPPPAAAKKAPPAPKAAAAPPQPAAPPPPAGPVLSEQEEQTLVRQSCAFDYRRLCRLVPIGGGRVIDCLASKSEFLSPACGVAIKVVRPGR